MQITIYKCDICGAEMKPEDAKRAIIDERTYDLCRMCNRRFKTYFAKQKEGANNDSN